jgi:hypothetical protein
LEAGDYSVHKFQISNFNSQGRVDVVCMLPNSI